MKIKIDTKLLEEQMNLVGRITKNVALNKYQIELLDGLENLLGHFIYAAPEIEVDIQIPVPNGRMTIRELITYDCDVDVANNVTDELGHALCCPMELTEEGNKEWDDVLDYVVYANGHDNYAECIVDDQEPEFAWEDKLKRLHEFLAAAAGYCHEDDYDKWFMD